jgi:hypothetical protein
MTVWHLAWQSAFARRRLFMWNIAVPALLLTPVALSDAAAPHRTAVFGVFFVFFATFGSSIPAVRDTRSGWIDSVFLTGYRRWRWFGETSLAGTTLDFLQLAPVALLLVWTAGGATPAGVASLAVGMLGALMTANVVGIVIAALVRSLAEAALVSAATSLLLLHFAGFFRTPTPGWTGAVAAWMPYRPLREALAAVQSPGSAGLGGWEPALLTTVFLVAAALLLAHAWTRRFEWPFAE